jgi:hypothetical protein
LSNKAGPSSISSRHHVNREKRIDTASASNLEHPCLIRSAERDSDGFLKLESLNFFETPSPTETGKKKCGPKPGDKKQQKATTHLSLFVASAPEISSLLVAFSHLNLSPFVAFCRYTQRNFISL